MNWDTIVDGLYVSALGMVMVSAVLVLLAVTVRAVSRGDEWFEERGGFRFGGGEPAVAESGMPGASTDDISAMPAASRETEQVAAVAVAIALAIEAQHAGAAGSGAHQPSVHSAGASDAWLAQGRLRQFARRAASVNREWSRR